MKLQILLTGFLFLMFISLDAQVFFDEKRGIDKSTLKSSTLLVEAFEAIPENCKNKPVLLENNFSTMPVYFCPSKDLSKQQKKKIAKFNNGKFNKITVVQRSLWNGYAAEYELVTQSEIDSEKYSDKTKYRYVLRYNYAMATAGFANGNSNQYIAYRYNLYDRLEDKEYDTIRFLGTDTDLKKLGSLGKIIKRLSK